MNRSLVSGLITLVLVGLAFGFGLMLQNAPAAPVPEQQQAQTQEVVASPSETIPPSTPLPTFTPSRTLLPPPTLEAPTNTPPPSNTPTITPTFNLNIVPTVAGIRGFETATPSSTPGCEVDESWTLTYTVQANDALFRIAERYNTTVEEIARANCLSNPDLIQRDQVLRVPGTAHPGMTDGVDCGTPWELLAPMNEAAFQTPQAQLTFNWRGPRAPRNLLRVIRPDGTTWERSFDLRQNESVHTIDGLDQDGRYIWYIIPLDLNFRQVCPTTGGPWHFVLNQVP